MANFRGVVCGVVLLLGAVSAGAQKRNLGHLSGNFESNTIGYIEDKLTGAIPPKNHYGSNNYLKLDYRIDRFSAGIQMEYYPQPLLGTPVEDGERYLKGFDLHNITGAYAAWTDRNYSVLVGSFYEQFGSGLLLRSWEDRALGFNNSLAGARVTFNIGNFLEGKAIFGLPRLNLDYRTDWVAGLDLSFSLSEAIGLSEHSIRLEGSLLNRHHTQFSALAEAGALIHGYKLPRNSVGYSARAAWEHRGWSAKFEYVDRGPDALLGAEKPIHGEAILAEAGYAGDGFSVVGQFRRLHRMETRILYGGSDAFLLTMPGNTLNYLPALSPQHGYLLTGLDPNMPVEGIGQFQSGEMATQIDAFYLFKRGTALGGKRGTKIHANIALSYDLDGATGRTNDFRYRDISLDIDKAWNSRLRTILFMSFQKNARHNTEQNIFVADVTYKFTSSFSLRGQLEYNYAPDTRYTDVDGDWVAGLLEANFAPKWSIFVSDAYNHGGSKVHYYSAGASFTHSFLRVALSWGRNRAGQICSGGVCRYIPAYTGGNLALTMTF